MKHILPIFLIIFSIFISSIFNIADASVVNQPIGGKIKNPILNIRCTGKGMPTPFNLQKANRPATYTKDFFFPISSKTYGNGGAKIGSYVLGMYNPVPNFSSCTDQNGDPVPETGFIYYANSK